MRGSRRHQRLDRLRRGRRRRRRSGRRCRARSGRRRGGRSGSATKTESPVPVRWIARDAVGQARARRDGHGLAPAEDAQSLVGERRDALGDGAFGEFAHAASVVRLARRARARSDGRRAGARQPDGSRPLGLLASAQWIDAASLGIALVLVSACAFGSGALFAQPVYDAGRRLARRCSAWRFLFGAALRLGVGASPRPDRRRGLRAARPAARSVVAVALGVLYTGNSGTYYAGLETVPAVARGADRLHLPGDRRRAVAAVRPAARGPAAVDRARRSRSSASSSRSAGSTRRCPPLSGLVADRRLAGHLLGLDRPVGAAVRRAARDRSASDGRRRGADAAAADRADDDRRPRPCTGSAALVAGRAARARPSIPADGVARAGRRRRRRDVRRDPDVLRRGAADRGGPGGARQHGRADLDDHARGDPVRRVARADPARRRGAHPRRRADRPGAGEAFSSIRPGVRLADE